MKRSDMDCVGVFERGMFGCGCARCGGVWFGVSERQCDCPAERGLTAEVTSVDDRRGIVTYTVKR